MSEARYSIICYLSMSTEKWELETGELPRNSLVSKPGAHSAMQKKIRPCLKTRWTEINNSSQVALWSPVLCCGTPVTLYKCTHTHKPTEIDTHTHSNTDTHIHTLTDKHRGTCIHTHRGPQKQIQTHVHTDTYIHTLTDTHRGTYTQTTDTHRVTHTHKHIYTDAQSSTGRDTHIRTHT